jgi:hypothetical protein
MKPSILVHVEDPGAANGVAGLEAPIEARGTGYALVAEGAAARFLAERGVAFEDVSARGADQLLADHEPTLLLVGTSENTRTLAFDLVARARSRGIPTAAFVDAFPNAEQRFRGETDDPLAHAPEFLLVPDDWTAAAFARLGVPSSRIATCGHPHYDTVLAQRKSFEATNRQQLRAELFRASTNQRIVVFCSEISTGLDPGQFRRSADYTLAGRGDRDGRTEIVLEELVDAIARLERRPHMVLRMHPKNTREELADFLQSFDEISTGGSPMPLLYAADLVVGMTSTILIEAALLGTPTLAIVPRDIERQWLPTIQANVTPCASTRAALDAHLKEWEKGHSPPALSVASGATMRMVEWLVDHARVRE